MICPIDVCVMLLIEVQTSAQTPLSPLMILQAPSGMLWWMCNQSASSSALCLVEKTMRQGEKNIQKLQEIKYLIQVADTTKIGCVLNSTCHL